MGRWRKTACLLLAAAIVCMALAGTGCGKKEKVTVKFSYPPYGYNLEKDTAYWKNQIKEFEAANPDIHIQFTVENWDDVYTKWERALETGETPDLGYDCPIVAVEYALQGGVQPVTDVVDKLGGDKAFSKGVADFKLKGEWYGVPHGDCSMIMMYRKDILQAAGFNKPPANWDETIEIARATTKDGVYGLGFYTGDGWQTNQICTALMKAAGGVMIDSKGKVALDSPENLKALEYVDNVYNKLKVMPESTVTWEHSDPANTIGLGQVAMVITWGGFGTEMQSMFPDTYDKVGYVKQPDGPSGHSGSWSGTGGFFLFKNAKHPAEAKKFIEFVDVPEKSKEWALTSGNISPFVSVMDDPELMKLEWYKAMQDQSPTQITLGWDHEIIPGDYSCDPHFSKALSDVTVKKVSPREALETLQREVVKTIEDADKKSKDQ